MAKDTKYYLYKSEWRGERYFKVAPWKDVVQIVVYTQPKKGRPYQKGITLMKYISFIGSWGWKLKESKNIKEVSKAEFEKMFEKILKRLRK